jgi:hypothetical protein
MLNLPIITNPKDVSIYKFERKSIFRYLKQIEELFEKETNSKELGLFLAEPLENDFNKKISWSTKAEGPIRNMSQLSPEEKSYVASKVQEYSDQIRAIANKLETTNSSYSYLSADILNNLLITRELPEALFLVGNQVVMTEWGCAPYGRYDRSNFQLTKQIIKIDPEYIEPEPKVAEVIRKTEEPQLTNEIDQTNQIARDSGSDLVGGNGATPTDVSTNIERSWSSLWRWLVILLLAMLLIFGLSLKSCSRFNQVDNGAEETALRSEINSLWIKVKEKAQACLPKKEDSKPPLPPAAANEEKWKNKDLSVFEGNWIFSGDNIVSASTGERIVMQLKFASDGSAVSSVRTESGDICSAGASATFKSEKRFTVNTGTLSCKKGGTWTMSRNGQISCNVRPNYTQADCTLLCKSGSCTGVFERK